MFSLQSLPQPTPQESKRSNTQRLNPCPQRRLHNRRKPRRMISRNLIDPTLLQSPIPQLRIHTTPMPERARPALGCREHGEILRDSRRGDIGIEGVSEMGAEAPGEGSHHGLVVDGGGKVAGNLERGRGWGTACFAFGSDDSMD